MISLCAITRNEADCIDQMLASVAGLVTEMIVVDTGSTDTTREIARACGARVVEIPWPHDFARARNVSLELASSPWILVLDADEALDAAAIPFLRGCAEGPPQSVWLERRHYQPTPAERDDQALALDDPLRRRGAQSFVSTSDLRFFPNLPAARYEGAVHESIEEPLDRAGLPSLRSTSIIHHYGPLASPERRREKTARYIELAQRKVLDAPADWRAHFQLGVELFTAGFIEDSIRSLERAVSLNSSYGPAWRQLAVAHMLRSDDQSALVALNNAVSAHPGDTVAWQALGVCFARLGHTEQAALCFQTILKAVPDYRPAVVGLSALGYPRPS